MSENTYKAPLGTTDRIFSNISGWSEKRSFSLPEDQHSTKAELELALTVLLVDLAQSDQNFDTTEYQVIVDGVHRIFGSNALQVKALVNQAMLVLKDLRGTERFGSLLKENLTGDQRLAIMEVVGEVINSDGAEDGFEKYIRYKISSVLGIELLEKEVE